MLASAVYRPSFMSTSKVTANKRKLLADRKMKTSRTWSNDTMTSSSRKSSRRTRIGKRCVKFKSITTRR